ncbi:olfactory receptor 52B2-like [Conger conger]|uniref:olfactory receptor 52B2-like n=1 Tax=Conger conger TaxID=82655 RepID=UPI002A5A7F27|nr:olfactory receptor 52B2-like [Conger conger]
MNQSSLNATLIFTSYGSFHPLNYFFFALTLIFYLLSVCSNVFLMLVICFESSLHKPMYILLFNLAINGLLGSSAVWPKIMDILYSNTKEISQQACLLQVFWVNVYATCVYTTLTAMAYDRYVSICKPLQYHTIMTASKVKQLLLLVNVIPACVIALQIYLTSRLPLCKYTIDKMFCDNLTIVNLSCIRSTIVNLYGLCVIIGLILLPIIIVLVSYVMILTVCLKTSKDAQKKALSTCSPHLITFINFSLASLFNVIYNRVHSSRPSGINIFFSLHFVMVPPLLHPIVYGIRTQEIRRSIARILRKRDLCMVV